MATLRKLNKGHFNKKIFYKRKESDEPPSFEQIEQNNTPSSGNDAYNNLPNHLLVIQKDFCIDLDIISALHICKFCRGTFYVRHMEILELLKKTLNTKIIVKIPPDSSSIPAAAKNNKKAAAPTAKLSNKNSSGNNSGQQKEKNVHPLAQQHGLIRKKIEASFPKLPIELVQFVFTGEISLNMYASSNLNAHPDLMGRMKNGEKND